MPKPRTAKDSAARLLLQTQALALRAHGHSFRSISRTLNVCAATAHSLVKSAMAAERKFISEAKADYIELEIHRLDTYLQALALKVKSGDPRAVDTALKIGERRAKLLGLDAPTKVAPTDPTGDKSYSGVLVVPGSLDPKAWEDIAIPSQAALKTVRMDG
jgi:hypothetical protein